MGVGQSGGSAENEPKDVEDGGGLPGGLNHRMADLRVRRGETGELAMSARREWPCFALTQNDVRFGQRV